MIRRSLPALLGVAALALAGCGGGGSSEPAAGGTGSTTSTHASNGTTPTSGTSPAASGTVDGVSLTPEGSQLKVGDTAKVSWQPNQKTTGVAAITVTGLLKMPISAFDAWRLTGQIRRSTPYFVHARVRNLGKSDLSHVAVPLYLLDQRQTLLQASTFQAQFTPCPSQPLPAHFRRGHSASVCLVYFVPKHGKLVAISFRPTQDFNAITWKGDAVHGGRSHRQQKSH